MVAVIALIALLAVGVSSKGADQTLDDAIANGQKADPPRLDLPPLGGNGLNQTLANYKGKVVVLNIWASWCAPCRQESPLLEKWHQQMKTKGGTVLGVDTQDLAGDADGFVKKYGLSYPILRDKDGSQIRKWGTIAFPETFVIDRDGKVVALRRGTVDDEFMHKAVAPLLEQQ
jgi:cytochrome c biogenesis protein CcmG/thiol:disulfide interchange protein DsbE